VHADWSVTMGCGDVCPYVPTTVGDWDIPDPAGRSIDEVREIRDLIDERVRGLATINIDAIRSDGTAHRWRLAKLLPHLVTNSATAARPRRFARAPIACLTATTMSRLAATS